MKRWRIIAVVLLVILILALLLRPRTPVVEAVEAYRGDLAVELFTTGIVESKLVDVAPRIVAPIAGLFASENQEVALGQLLATLNRDELIAQVNEAQAALDTAQQQLAQAQESVRATAAQTAAAVSRAQAGVRAARARLADVQRGARPQEVEQARAAVRQARAEAAQAQADLRRAEQLFERGAISRQQLDAARTAAQVAAAQVTAAEQRLALVQEGARAEEVRIAQAEVEAAEAALAEARAGERVVAVRRREVAAAQAQVDRARAALQAAEAQLQFAVVRSPIAGVVARRHLEVGEIAGPQAPIYTLASLDPIWVTAEVDEDDLAALQVGQRVTVTSGAFPGREATGTVVRTSPIAEPRAVGLARARIVRARVDIGSTEFRLRPGMEVDIESRAVVARSVVLIPNEAVARVGDATQVYVVEGERLYPRAVETGLSSFELTEIRRGLAPGELVAVTRPPEPEAGQQVRVRRLTGGR